MGELNVSRAFGDARFKIKEGPITGPLVSCTPSFSAQAILEHDEYLVLGSDGVFNILSAVELYQLITSRMQKHHCLQATSAEVSKNKILYLFYSGFN